MKIALVHDAIALVHNYTIHNYTRASVHSKIPLLALCHGGIDTTLVREGTAVAAPPDDTIKNDKIASNQTARKITKLLATKQPEN